jgi:hypothetical protein
VLLGIATVQPSSYLPQNLKPGCGESVFFVLFGEETAFRDESVNQFPGLGMMKMTQAVKGCSLTNPGVAGKHFSESLKKEFLQLQILATSPPISISAIPVVTQ